MRVVFIGKSHDYSLIPLHAVARQHEIVGLVESAPRKPPAPPRGMARLRSVYRRFFPSRNTFPGLARTWRVPYMFLSRDTRPGLVEFLKAARPDIVCVSSLSLLLPAEVLEIPRFGVLNNHPSMLPKYHGPFPWFWQYYEYEQHFGATIHRIDEGQDTGPIIKQEPFFVERGTDINAAVKLGAELGARLMCEALSDLQRGQAEFRAQPYHDFPKARIVKRDEEFVKWEEWPIERVWHFLRGAHPWLDSVAYPKGVWRSPGKFERCGCVEKPGSVHRDGNGYFIAHGEGKIRLVG